MIANEVIEEIKSRIDIVDVISDFLTLKKNGQNYKALSPFTNEKTASFYVVPSKGIFKDFSSGKGGDAIAFIMAHESFGYIEALRYLAKKYGIEIPQNVTSEQESERNNERESLYLINAFAKEYFKENLHDEEGPDNPAMEYLTGRDLTKKIISDFELGYALPEWRALEEATQMAGYSKDILLKSGLVVEKDDSRSYDRFRDRVIFPIHNLSGRVIGFGGRQLREEKEQPKYINSPESPLYRKSEVLYGLFQGKLEIKKLDFSYLVEGYTDVLSLHQSGIKNVVASSGTSLTVEQVSLIKRFTNNVTILFDGDAAGLRAALRGINLILKAGLNVKIVVFPEGEDPDSFARKNTSEALNAFLKEKSKDFISFKIDLFASEITGDPIKKAELIRDIVTSIALIPDVIKRAIYLQDCSKKLDVPLSILTIETKKILLSRPGSELAPDRGHEQEQFARSLSEVHSLSREFIPTSEESLINFEKEFVKVLLTHGHVKFEDRQFAHEFLFEEIADVDFISPEHREILEVYKFEIANGSSISPEYIISVLPEKLASYVSGLVIQKHFISDGWKSANIIIGEEYNPEEAIPKVILQMKLGVVMKMISENLKKTKETKDQDEQAGLLEIHVELNKFKNAISEPLGRIVTDTLASKNL